MPIALWSLNLFNDRVEFEGSLTTGEVQALAAHKDLKVLQCSKPIEPRTWVLLNDEFFTRRPDVQLRVYGFYSRVCDLTFTAGMTNVLRFSADCLMDAVGVEHIASMENLESLAVGIYHLESFEFLNRVTQGLKRLFLGRTRSKKPDLSPVSRFGALEAIYVEGHQKNIDVLSQLLDLQDVTLRSISTPDIRYLRPLHRMWSLDIKLGGIKDLTAIEGMEQIKYLELWQVRGLADIGVISSLTGLQFLLLQSLRQVTALPRLDRLQALRRICLENMRGLTSVSSLEFAPALEEFIHTGAKNVQPDDYAPLLRNPNLKRAAVLFGSNKKNGRFDQLLRERDVQRGRGFEEFEFA